MGESRDCEYLMSHFHVDDKVKLVKPRSGIMASMARSLHLLA